MTIPKPLATAALALALALGISFGAAFAVARATDDDPAPTATEEPVAVVAPVAVDVDPTTLDDPAGPALDVAALRSEDGTGPAPAEAAAGTRISPTVSEQVRARAPRSRAEPTGAAALDAALAPQLVADAGRPRPDPEAAAGEPGVGLFVDPCAGGAPGDGAEGPECEGGVGATVLAVVSPAPMQAILMIRPDHVDASIPGWRRCEYPDGDGVPAIVVTNNPIDAGTITFHQVYDVAATRRTLDLDPTVEDERARWEAAEAYPERWWEGPQHCVRLPAAGDRGVQWAATARVQGVGGEATSSAGWTVPDERDRPPVSVQVEGANHLRIVAPVQSSDMVVSAAAVPYGPSGTGDCASHEAAGTEPAVETRSDRRVLPDERLDEDVLASPDYPYAPSWDARKGLVLELDEGTSYHLCIRWWYQPASFDDARVVGREARFVMMPDRRRATFRVVGHTLARPTGADEVSVAVTEPGRGAPLVLERRNPRTGACSATLPEGISPRGGSNTVLDEPLVMCGTEGHVDDLSPFPEVDVVTQLRDADRQRVRLPVDLDAPGSRSALYRIPLTGARRLCGTGPFGGDCAEPRDDAGSVLVEVAYDEGRRSGLRDGFVGEPTTWTGPASTSAPPSEFAQLDHFDDLITDAEGEIVGIRPRTYTMAVEGRTDALELHLRTDRDVVATATAEAAPGRERCLREGSGTATAPVRARTDGVVTLTGLCARTHYFLRVELTTATGQVTRIEPYGGSGWNSATTHGWQAEWAVNAYIETYPGGDWIAVLVGEVVVDARPVDLRREGPSPSETSNECFSGRNRYIHRAPRRGFYGDDVTLDVRFVLGDYTEPVSRWTRERSARCIHRGVGEPTAASVTESLVVPAEELFAGRFTRVLDDGAGLRIMLHIDSTDRSVGPGYGYPDDRWRR